MNYPNQPGAYAQGGYQQVNMQPGYQQQQMMQPGYQQPMMQQGYQQPMMQPAYQQQPMRHPQRPPHHSQQQQNYQPVPQQKPKSNQIMPAQPKAKQTEEKVEKEKEEAHVNWGGEDSSSDSEVGFIPGRSYCCGLFNSGDSMCYNCCKFIIVFVVCPLVCYWLYKSGNLEKLIDKAGSTFKGSCQCCKKICVTVSAKLRDCHCITKYCNSDKCKHCCGIQRCCEGICNCFKGFCEKGCFSKICGCVKNFFNCSIIKDFCGKCCGCFKDAIKCGSIAAFCKSICKCDFDKLKCCDKNLGCDNPCQCCGQLPCCKKCKDLDGCSCCSRAGNAVKDGGKKIGGCCTQVKERCCNCCFQFKKKAGSKGSSLSKNFGRGRYKGNFFFKQNIR